MTSSVQSSGTSVQAQNETMKQTTTRLRKKKLAFLAAWITCAEAGAHPQNAIDNLQPLVETSARRLVIAEQVALAKWDSGTPVEDTAREAQVIAGVIQAGESRGLHP